MSADKEKLRQAYVDGELSAAEIAAFEAQLSAEDRELLAKETQFELALANVLRHDDGCPDDVWRRTQAQLAAHSAPPRRRRYTFVSMAVVAASAALALMILMRPATAPEVSDIPPAESARQAVENTPSIPVVTLTELEVALPALTVEELAALSEIEAGEANTVAFLRDNGVDLHVQPLESLSIARVHYGIKALGARRGVIDGSPVIQVLLECCGHPEVILIAAQESPAAERLNEVASVGGDVQAVRSVGNYVTAIVGKHRAQGLLDAFVV